jgi:hypothetical protein
MTHIALAISFDGPKEFGQQVLPSHSHNTFEFHIDKTLTERGIVLQIESGVKRIMPQKLQSIVIEAILTEFGVCALFLSQNALPATAFITVLLKEFDKDKLDTIDPNDLTFD